MPAILFVAVIAVLAWTRQPAGPKPFARPTNQTKPTIKAESDFNKDLYPSDVAASPWVVVNKGRVLRPDYVPNGLTAPDVQKRLAAMSSEMLLAPEAGAALKTMFGVAQTQNVSLKLFSGYRSYYQQQAVYSSFVSRYGVASTDTFSARPGHSEHQTGLAADIEPLNGTCELETCFETTPEGVWLAANSYKYGFIIRYQKDRENITGYQYEPWHIRYVGQQLSLNLFKSGQSMEEFFGLPVYVVYPNEPLQLR